MSTEENKILVRKDMEEGFGAGILAIFDESFASDYINHNGFVDQQPGLAWVKREYVMFRQAFPDLSITIEDLIAAEDKVVVRSMMKATHQETFPGVEPAGKSIAVEEISIYRIAQGKIVERWGLNTDFMSQIQ